MSRAAAGVLLIACAAGADWPHLRGPAYDGVSAETGLAESWPQAGPPLLWSCPLGQGYSGSVVAQGRVYTQRQTLGGQELLCLDAADGHPVWTRRYDDAWRRGGAYPGPYASPTWYRDRVYFASPSGLVGCVDAATGAPRWSVNVNARFGGRGTDFGYAATPLVEDDRVILPVGGPDAALVALHADDGHTVWTAGSDPASYCPALPITWQGRRLVVGYLQNSWLLAELATGAVVYRQPLSHGYDEHSAWPLYQEPHLLVTAPFRSPAQSLRLEAGVDQVLRSPTAWLSRSLANDVVSSVLYRDHVYGFDLQQLQASRHRALRGVFRCLEWTTGKVCWSTDEVGQAGVLAADGKLLMLNDSGSLILAQADSREYRELARAALFEDEICWTPPALSAGRLYVRCASRLVCLHVGRAEDAPASRGAAVTSHGWRFDVAWLVRRERAFPNDALSAEELALWFAAGLLDLAAAAGVAWLIRYTIRRAADRDVPAAPLVWGGTFFLAVLGPGVVSAWLDELVFTWLMALYAAFHGAVLAYLWVARAPNKRHARWLARLALAGLVLVGYGYFELCRAAGMYIGWAFLAGFPAALPLTLLAAHAERGRRPWLAGVWTVPGFALFLGSGQALLWLKTAHAG